MIAGKISYHENPNQCLFLATNTTFTNILVRTNQSQIRCSLVGQDIRLSPERPGFKSRQRKLYIFYSVKSQFLLIHYIYVNLIFFTQYKVMLLGKIPKLDNIVDGYIHQSKGRFYVQNVTQKHYIQNIMMSSPIKTSFS